MGSVSSAPVGSAPVVPFSQCLSKMSPEMINEFQAEYKSITQRDDLDGFINFDDFQRRYAVPARELGPTFDRLYDLLDHNGSLRLEYEEFICGMYIFSISTRLEKIKFLFKLYDADASGCISRKEFDRVVRRALKARDAGKLLITVDLDKSSKSVAKDARKSLVNSSPGLNYIIGMEFKKYDTDNVDALNYEQFKRWAYDNPSFLEWMSAFLPEPILHMRAEAQRDKCYTGGDIGESMALDDDRLQHVTLDDHNKVTYTGVGDDATAKGGYQIGYALGSKYIDASMDDMFYFEVKITDAGSNDGIAIGFYSKDVDHITGMPGWWDESIAYHGDEGGVRRNGTFSPFFGESMREGEREFFSKGDVIGAAMGKNIVFFTKNGKVLDRRFAVGECYFPTVSIVSPGASCEVNFGDVADFVCPISLDVL